MKKIKVLVALLAIVSVLICRAQIPQKIAYQAVIRNANGEVIGNEPVELQVKFHKGTTDGEVVYTENHTVTTSPFGVASLHLGEGTNPTGNFTAIPWSETIFLEVLYKPSGTSNFASMGTTQILSVPYAFLAGTALTSTNGISSIGSAGNVAYSTGQQWEPSARICILDSTVIVAPKVGHDPDKPIFAVTNSQGQVVMAVYESGVRFYVSNSDTKGVKGGFAVGGLTSGKVSVPPYFQLEPGYAQFLFDQTAKGVKGGFAVGGLTAGKSDTLNYLSVTPNFTQVGFIPSAVKGVKGGFAVGGLSNGKSTVQDIFEVTPDSTYIINTMVSYSDMVTTGNVTTNLGLLQPQLTDIDGNLYSTVKIGTQTWMAENLKTQKYSDGTTIPSSFFYSFTNVDSAKVFGNYYLDSVLFNHSGKNVCPSGWHVPTNIDWETLFAFAGGTEWIINSTTLAKKIIEPHDTINGIENWYNASQLAMIATNETGFSARGASLATWSIGNWTPPVVGDLAYFLVDETFPKKVSLDAYSGTVSIVEGSVGEAYSIRCVKDK